VNYDSFCMAAAARELQETCGGSWVDQIHQPEPLRLTLAFTGGGPRRYWLFSADARWPRAHATTIRRANPSTAPNFCMLLRKHLGGAVLAEVEQVRFDRILRLDFRRGDERRTLIHEVMGRHSNLILLDEAGVILGAIKAVPPSQSRFRPVLPGLPYEDPPGVRDDPRLLSDWELQAFLGDAPAPADLTRVLSGWGTFAAREAVASGNAVEFVAEVMERVREGHFEPGVLEDEQGRPKGVWAFLSRQEGWTRHRPAASMSQACDTYYGYLESTSAVETLRKTLLAVLDRVLRTASLQVQEAEAALEGLDRAEQQKIKGELLASQGGVLERGATSIRLPNWYDPEQRELEIELDPELDRRENAERYFHRYRRATAAAEAALDRIPELHRRRAELEAYRHQAAAGEEAELRALLETLRAQGVLREAGAAGGGSPGKGQPTSEFPPGVRIKRVRVGEWEVLYGENATSNDYLTTRCARPSDLWLHARAVTGAHVVVRNVTTLDRLPAEVLREAARIAAAHSDGRHSSVVPVDYTFRRYVRKPRGSAPGRVTYSGEKTIDVQPG